MNFIKVFIISILITNFSLAQNLSFSRIDTIKIFNQTSEILFPWVGGMNAVQFSTIDLDFDGDEDLFVFDRTGNKIITYINDGSSYVYNSDYENDFPELNYWALLRDYNKDGKKDIFSYVSGGIGVWKNTSTNGNISFTKLNLPFSYLESFQYSMNTNLYVSKVDLPDINDIDGDGDLDVLTFGVFGGRVEYHKNLSVESGYNSDSLIFELKNACWGHFLETGFNTNTCLLYDTCNNVSNPETPILNNTKSRKHSGSSILSLDLNNDSIKDIILGDVSFTNLVALTNDNIGINMNTSFVSQDTTFPSNTVPVDLYQFPGPFYEDIDLDGVSDLIVSPNSSNETQNKESVWFYRNFGTNSQPIFNLISKNYFQTDMIETGRSAHPILFDYNNDGLLDLFVANFGYRDLTSINNYVSTIYLYENTGTLNNPQFTLITDDFQNISQLNIDKDLFPSFGDLDNDGDYDMLLGDYSGYLHYFENSSSSLSSFNLTLSIPQYTDDNSNAIDIGYAAKPTLFDVDNDGDLDLTIGEQNGNLNYYENIGTASVPLFRLITDVFGNIDVTDWWTTVGNSIPLYFRDSAGLLNLLVGSDKGDIFLYDSIDNNIIGTFNVIDTNFLDYYLGPAASPTIGDLDNDSINDIIVGNERGGITYFKGAIDTSSSSNTIIQNILDNIILYPNPCKDKINVSGVSSFTYTIYDVLSNKMLSGYSNGEINITNLSKGVYILKLEDKNITYTKSFVSW